jgi:uncharacterized protein with PQ loop repeat
MNAQAIIEQVKSNVRGLLDINHWASNIREHAPRLSAETMGWIAVILMHLATIPTLLAVLTGLTEKMPPVDLVLFAWAGLFCFFIKAAIQKDFLNIVTIGFGFFVQAGIMAMIIFK